MSSGVGSRPRVPRSLFGEGPWAKGGPSPTRPRWRNCRPRCAGCAAGPECWRTAWAWWVGIGAAARRWPWRRPYQCKPVWCATLPCRANRAWRWGCGRRRYLGSSRRKILRRKEKLSAFRQLLVANKVPCQFHVAEGVQAGFLGPPEKKPYAHDAAEDAWLAIYNFLEKHVEDAGPPDPPSLGPAGARWPRLRISCAPNQPTGLRGGLGKALEQKPGSLKEWQRIRANAALMAEAGAWLRRQSPPKGPSGHWQEQAQAFTQAAEALVNAADQRDYLAAQRGLAQLAGQCGPPVISNIANRNGTNDTPGGIFQ